MNTIDDQRQENIDRIMNSVCDQLQENIHSIMSFQVDVSKSETEISQSIEDMISQISGPYSINCEQHSEEH